MTFLDLYCIFPLWIQIILGILFFIWSVEVFLLPFKYNINYHRNKEIETILRGILGSMDNYHSKLQGNENIQSLILGYIKGDINRNKSEDKDV